MNAVRTTLISGVLVVASSLSIASGPEGSDKLKRLFALTNDLRTTPNVVMASSYPGTECVDFSFKRSKVKVGFVCASKNGDFIKEMGVTDYDALPAGSRPSERPISGLLVATAMRQYEMRAFTTTEWGAASAVVDCDTDGAANYRAASSCHIAVSPLAAQEVIYSNFVLTDHTSGKRGISERRIKEIWQLLEKR
jgi:hypothetical protein